ncbi:hypothetical protein CFIMG_004341RA [Ceratocystis fimbriata CBS 114723]|uniref:FAD dependent oxidoreductase domain-containing protein n=1 Tax=Ceratocystis fimbriata CBS 114723 TaxID=1035309 RepID=A0A2C5WYK0_9PEZI|nr:hypothetical protein CFIMG_004341RA [Ceratocystis fimbriata CBS 114723]
MYFHFPFPVPATSSDSRPNATSTWAESVRQKAAAPVSLPAECPLPSYWIREACDVYSGGALPDAADIVIVGSGISGAMVAWNLLQETTEPISILMLEARDVCSGATGRNGGHTKGDVYFGYSGPSEDDERLKIIRLQEANIKSLHKIANELGIECGQEKCDTIDVFYSQTTWDSCKASITQLEEDAQDSIGTKHSVYDAADFPTHHQCFTSSKGLQAKGIVEYPAGRISGYKLVRGILDKCVEKGMRITTRCPVTKLDNSQGDGWRVTTPRGVVSCKKVVLATNGYTAGLSSVFHKAVIPVRGDVVAVRATPEVENAMTNNSMSFIYSENDFEYMTIQPKTESAPYKALILGGGLSYGPSGVSPNFGNTDDSTVNENTQEYLKSLLPRIFGENWGTDDAEQRVEIGWSGIMGFTLDGAPLVGEVPGQPGLWASVAFQGNGMTMAMKCAEALCKMMVGKRDELEWFPQSFCLAEERLKTDTFWNEFGQRQE